MMFIISIIIKSNVIQKTYYGLHSKIINQLLRVKDLQKDFWLVIQRELMIIRIVKR